MKDIPNDALAVRAHGSPQTSKNNLRVHPAGADPPRGSSTQEEGEEVIHIFRGGRNGARPPRQREGAPKVILSFV